MSKTIFGHDANGRAVELTPEQRQAHMHVIGSSGSGKSKFLEWLMRGDLHNRQGFCLIDPHGTLYDDVLDYCAHHVLKREIVLLNLSQPAQIVGFNPFQRVPGADLSVQVDRRIQATMHAWNVPNTDQTPTLERTLRLIYTVMIAENVSLPQVQHLIDFNAQEIREHLIAKLDSPLIRKEWQELQSLKAKEWRDEILSAKNRLFRFLTSPALCRFMGVPDHNLNLREIMDEGKVLLVNLNPSDHLSAENGRVFGALLINEFFEAARRREKDGRGHDPKPYHMYIDEHQNFIGLDMADMLDQVRKRGLFLTLAHQRFGQIDENITDAVLTNCRIKAVFGGLPVPSAKLMAEELFIGELDPERIKVAIYQTKFWPTYARDKVYARSHGTANATGLMESAAHGLLTSTGSGDFFQPGDWFSGPLQVGASAMTNTGTSFQSGSGSSKSRAESESESVADIPIMLPVPFQELSSVQFYSTDEQLLELTAALKEQFPRHCFIKLHSEKTQPLLVPFVKGFYTGQKNRDWYVQKLFREQGALPAEEADRLLESNERALLKAVAESGAAVAIDIEPEPATNKEAEAAPKPARKLRTKPAPKPKPSIYDAIDLHDDGRGGE